MNLAKKILMLGAIATSFAVTAQAKAKTDQVIDRVAAIVNEKIITESDVQEQMGTMRNQLLMTGKDIPDDKTMHEKILSMMIDKEVQIQIADRADVKVDLEELNERIADIAKQNHVSIKQLRAQIEEQGITYETFRNNIRDQMRLQKLQSRSVGGKVTVSTKEVNEMLEELKAKHTGNYEYHLANILISLPEAPTSKQVQTAEQRADQVLSALHKGEKFNQIASKSSDGDQSLEGGDLGWRKIGELPEIFVSELKKMKEGDVRGPIRAPNGLHIIKLLGVKDGDGAPTKKQIKAMLYNRKMIEKVDEWVKQMRDSAYIQIVT